MLKLNITKSEAEEFLSLQECGDNLGIICLLETIKAHNPTDAIEHLLISLKSLNTYISLMETGEIEFQTNIDAAYRTLMCEVVEAAQAIVEQGV